MKPMRGTSSTEIPTCEHRTPCYDPLPPSHILHPAARPAGCMLLQWQVATPCMRHRAHSSKLSERHGVQGVTGRRASGLVCQLQLCHAGTSRRLRHSVQQQGQRRRSLSHSIDDEVIALLSLTTCLRSPHRRPSTGVYQLADLKCYRYTQMTTCVPPASVAIRLSMDASCSLSRASIYMM